MKVIISGGGTGGHIFPALSIAETLKRRFPDVEILFVGAENRMEMEKIPAAGFRIVGLPVAGFDRKHLLRNIGVLIKLRKSLKLAKKTLKEFKPDIAVGVGGYASGPTLKMAAKLGIPTLIQEQNSYAGVTNKLLAQKAEKICVAYDGMEKFFPKEKIVLTGNPVRQTLSNVVKNQSEAYAFFKLDPAKKTILIVGGSLGARTINNSIINSIDKLINSDVQILWQSGKFYIDELTQKLSQQSHRENIHLSDFISRMDYAYAVADLVISRAGASSISELCMLGKATILVPSPNVAEDHQTKNAMALVRHDAAVLVTDADAEAKLVDEALTIVHDASKLHQLSANIRQLALPDSSDKIVDEIEKIVKGKIK